MTKRIQFLTRRAGLHPVEFQTRWLGDFAQALATPSRSTPSRAVACIVLPGSEINYDAISMEWFDEASVEQTVTFNALIDPQASDCILVDELVLRGAAWLERRWLDTTPKYKHMALAHRAYGFSAAEFSERWRNRPGRLGGGPSAPVIEIPEPARGHAYIQNHPRQQVEASVFDAINEAYFDDLSAMRARIDFFAQHDLLKTDSELISQAHFAIVREHVISIRA